MIWEEGWELILSVFFLMTPLKFVIFKSFVVTEYLEVNYLLNASNSLVVSFMLLICLQCWGCVVFFLILAIRICFLFISDYVIEENFLLKSILKKHC